VHYLTQKENDRLQYYKDIVSVFEKYNIPILHGTTKGVLELEDGIPKKIATQLSMSNSPKY
jgi:hypothetical protein